MTTASNTGYDPERIARIILLILLPFCVIFGMLIGIGIKYLIA